MTTQLYYTSDELSILANVLECYESDGRIIAVLDRTVFHPQGGGQLADTGLIGASNVIGAVKSGEQILHVIDNPVPLGETVISVDQKTRQLHAVLHSAGHLIGHIGVQNGLTPTKAHHWPGESRVTFMLPTDPEKFDANYFQQGVDELLVKKPVRNYKIEGDTRLVSFGEFPAFPCGGTHVRSAAEIEKINILSVKSKKTDLVVSYEAVPVHSKI